MRALRVDFLVGRRRRIFRGSSSPWVCLAFERCRGSGRLVRVRQVVDGMKSFLPIEMPPLRMRKSFSLAIKIERLAGDLGIVWKVHARLSFEPAAASPFRSRSRWSVGFGGGRGSVTVDELVSRAYDRDGGQLGDGEFAVAAGCGDGDLSAAYHVCRFRAGAVQIGNRCLLCGCSRRLNR